jgi:hypothetical protein
MHPHVNSGLVMALTESPPPSPPPPTRVSGKVQKCGRTYLVKHTVVILINFLFFTPFLCLNIFPIIINNYLLVLVALRARSLCATVFLAQWYAKQGAGRPPPPAFLHPLVQCPENKNVTIGRNRTRALTMTALRSGNVTKELARQLRICPFGT